MKKSAIILATCLLTASMPMFSQEKRSSSLFSGKKASGTVTDQDGNMVGYETNESFFMSFDLGNAGLRIPAFTDLNGNPQSAYTIKSHDFMVQIGSERKFTRSPIHGPLVFGFSPKIGFAYSYWPTQQGSGEPGNYFASNGSYASAGSFLHSGDEINISGFRWTLTPDLTAHYPIGSKIEIEAAAGPCLYGYLSMKIRDPWSGYSTNISDSQTVGHYDFLENYFKTFSVTADWSVKVMMKAPGSLHKLFLEIGMTGKALIYGIGIVHPIIKKA
ncbi:MAG: hypothetical protein ABSG89_05090 [Bacteroidales bacterium]|jgi:hypothetical protein